MGASRSFVPRQGVLPMAELQDPRRHLASVSAVLEEARIKALIAAHSRPVVLDAIHETLDAYRRALKPGDEAPGLEATVDAVEAAVARVEGDSVRSVVNGTGIILHTGLGRAVLPREAVERLAVLSGCCNLQIDLETGLRGKRNAAIEKLLCRLTGAEAALVVNNNAAATLLILAALCKDQDVIVSRGQLIEIGGSFRLPDCVHQSGATLVEVGTTNKTHFRDYENALSERTGAIMHVHASNYRIVGFTQEVPVSELADLKRKQPLILIDDLGCGALIDLAPFGLPHEPTVQESIAAGADIVCFSGDKLISGPQAGIIVGRRALIAAIKKHPLTRMLRVCKLTAIALEQTLRLFLDPEALPEKHPTLRMLTAKPEALKRKAEAIQRRVAKAQTGLRVQVVESESAMGGGSLPGVTIPSYAIAVSSPHASAGDLSQELRCYEPPVIAHVKDDKVLIDMRTLLDGEDRIVADALGSIAGSGSPDGR